jgi:hypothetical protein
MPKINNNPIMKGVRGMLGDVVVYRQFRGTTIMSNRPRKSKAITLHQQAIKSRFLLAVKFAKEQIADPLLKAKYQPGPDSEFTSAYIAALADYLRNALADVNTVERSDAEKAEGQSELENIMVSDEKAEVNKRTENVGEKPKGQRYVEYSVHLTAYPYFEREHLISMTPKSCQQRAVLLPHINAPPRRQMLSYV